MSQEYTVRVIERDACARNTVTAVPYKKLWTGRTATTCAPSAGR